MKRIINFATLILISVLCFFTQGCDNTCPYISAPVSITPPSDFKKTSTKMDAMLQSWTFYYDPMILPFKIKFAGGKGFYVEHSDDNNVITPIGVFGLSFDISSPGSSANLGVTDGDFLVVLTNINLGTKQVFKIEGHNKLKILIDGRTELNFLPGYAEIDVTNSKIEEISFSDLAHSFIENPTTIPINIYLFIANPNNPVEFTTYLTQVPPESYIVVKNELFPVPNNNFIAVTSTDSLSSKESVPTITQYEKKLVGGTTYLVYADKTDRVLLKVMDRFGKMPKSK